MSELSLIRPEVPSRQSEMRKLLLSVTALPLKAGTWAPRNAPCTHAPTEVPANGADKLTADTLPSGEKVTLALPEPLGPPRQLPAAFAALLSAANADARLMGVRSSGGGAFGARGASGSGFAASAATGAGLGASSLSSTLAGFGRSSTGFSGLSG